MAVFTTSSSFAREFRNLWGAGLNLCLRRLNQRTNDRHPLPPFPLRSPKPAVGIDNYRKGEDDRHRQKNTSREG